MNTLRMLNFYININNKLILKKQLPWIHFSTIKLILSFTLHFFPFRNQHHAVVHHSFLIAEQESAQGELH